MQQSEALAEMERFASGKRVLYMAAHPDDENTRLIAWLSNALNAETTYLSLTRGSGGQNLLGDELGEDLGIIREHELLAARAIDGGNQEFTIATDLGYSKDVREVWQQWSKEVVTFEVVKTIRELCPDYIITRFPPDERAGHGHHTASAELAIECAKLAADPSYNFTDQAPWAVQGVWWNTSIWWDSELANDPKAVRLDMSGFDPLLGDTYGAIGDAARSMHKCQGFGVALDRGPREEYFKQLSDASGDFESYLKLGEQGVDSASVLAQDAYFALSIGDREGAIKHWTTLGTLLKEQGSTKARYQRWQRVFLHLTGIYAEYYTQQNPLVEGEEATFKVELQPMLPGTAVQVKAITFGSEGQPWAPRQPIQVKDETAFVHEIKTTKETGSATVLLSVNGQSVSLDLAPVAKLVDRAIGEYREEVAWEPQLYLKFEQPVVWAYQKKTKVKFQVYAHRAIPSQRIELTAWATIKEDIWTHRMETALEAGWNEFEVELPNDLPLGKFGLTASANGDYLKSKHIISYPHIGTSYSYPVEMATLAVLDLSKKRMTVGYIEGAGDQMDEMLEAVGYKVVKLTEESTTEWDEVEAILVGIRAFNIAPWLYQAEPKIKRFVERGGTFVVTYTTAGRGAGTELPLPVPLVVGRDRVTEEFAPVRFNLVDHPILNSPNVLNDQDFSHWVQERGLYFPVRYEGYETPLRILESTGVNYDNSLVVASYGKGAVIYTGLSLFRELPAGVPGSLRLLQNIIHYDR